MGAAGAVDDAELRARVRALHQPRVDRRERPEPPVRVGTRATRRLVRAWARAAPRPRGCVVRGRDLQAAAERHRLHDPQALGRPRPQLRAGRRQPRLPHVARHAGATDLGHDPADGRDDGGAGDGARWDRRLERGGRDVRFSDLLGRTVVVLADWQGRLLAVLAVLAGLFAWARMARRVFAGGRVHALSTGAVGRVVARRRGRRHARRGLAAARRARGLSPVVRARRPPAARCSSSAARRRRGTSPVSRGSCPSACATCARPSRSGRWCCRCGSRWSRRSNGRRRRPRTSGRFRCW